MEIKKITYVEKHLDGYVELTAELKETDSPIECIAELKRVAIKGIIYEEKN